MSLPDAPLVRLAAERGEGNQSFVFRIEAGGFPVRLVGRQWRMEFWNEDRTVKFCDAAADPQVADGNVLTLTFTEVELSNLPDIFWGDLLVVLESGRRRYLLRVLGDATGSGILINEVQITLGPPGVPPEWNPLIDRSLVIGSAMGRNSVTYTPLQELFFRVDRALVVSLLNANRDGSSYSPLQEAFQRIDRTLVSALVQVNRDDVGYGLVAPAPIWPELRLSLSEGWPRAFLPVGGVISVPGIVYSQSSVYGATTPISNAMMTDGSTNNTGAATNAGSLEWFQMDLGNVEDVAKVIIGTATSSIPGGWSRSYTSNREVRYSIDGSSWTIAFTTPNYAADGIYTTDVSFAARYIRLQGSGWQAMTEFYALSPGQTYP